MTITNTGFSASPFANPFNCRQIANYSLVGAGLGSKKSMMRLDPKASLPNPKPYQSSNLEVPNQLNASHYGSMIDVIGLQQAFPNLVACPDRTMIDIKSRKVIVDPNRSRCSSSEWAPTKIVSLFPEQNNDWNGASQSQSGCHQPANKVGEKILDDKQSDKYWKSISDEHRKTAMSDEQKQMLKDLENGNLMKLSRLEDEI